VHSRQPRRWGYRIIISDFCVVCLLLIGTVGLAASLLSYYFCMAAAAARLDSLDSTRLDSHSHSLDDARDLEACSHDGLSSYATTRRDRAKDSNKPTNQLL
jgi:hypothetical protein